MNDEPRTIKEALHNTIHRHETLSVEAIAEQLGMATSYLYRACLPDPDTEGPGASGVRFPLKQLVPLVSVTNDFQTLDYIENALGRVAVRIPPIDKVPCSDLRDHAMTAAAEFGDLMREVKCSVEDNKLTKEECKRIQNEGWQAVQAMMQIIVVCDR